MAYDKHKHHKLIGTIYENEIRTQRRKVERVDGNHVIYSTSTLDDKKWTDYTILFFCCSTISAMGKWGREFSEDNSNKNYEIN